MTVFLVSSFTLDFVDRRQEEHWRTVPQRRTGRRQRPCRLPELPDADVLGRKRVTPPHMAKDQGRLAFTEFLCVSTRQHR
jgi:hypothetical protein